MLGQHDSQLPTRRDFVRAAAATVSVWTAGGVLAACEWSDRRHAHSLPLEPELAKGGGGATTTRNALRIPATASPVGLTLTCAPGTANIGGGRSTAAWMYNGQFPGPTLVATKGDGATITLQNQLPQPSITHWHGMLVAHEDDGHPGQALATGDGYPYGFTVAQRACLSWYHPHPHLLTGEQVYRGLAGAFIVRDSQDTGSSGNGLALPHGAYEVPLIIRDASFDSRGNLSFGNKSSGFFGNVPLVNGTLQPFLSVDQAIYRFRVLNGCNARVLRLALTNGHQFTLIGNDGGLLETAVPALAEITLGPGERLDLIVDFRSIARDAVVMLRCLDAAWDLLQFRGTGNPGGDGALPSGALSTIDPLGAPMTVRRFSFDGMTRINGKTYAMERIDFEVPFDQTERWVFVTNGNGPHPVHVHGAFFQVQSRTGGRGQLFPWERGWKDTVLVADGETVEVLIRFTAHRGLYVMHCHQLAHEDNGMMANFVVV